jgi:hypothetical protein
MSNWTKASVADGRPGRPAGGNNRVGRRVTLLALSLAVLLPVGLAVVVFPLLAGDPFDSPDAIDPAAVKSLEVRVLNRKELDGGEDIGPYFARPADVPALLAPLRGLTPLDAKPAVVGPWLGEYRIRTTGGRRGTVRFYWHRTTPHADAAMAVTGAAVLRRPELVPGAFGLRVQVGGRWFEGGQPLAVVAAALTAGQ